MSEYIDNPKGCIAGPMERLRQAMECTPNWMEFVGRNYDDDGSEEHRQQVFYFNVQDIANDDTEEMAPAQVAATRPFVLMHPDYPQGFTIERDSSSGFRTSGSIQVVMEKNEVDFEEFTTSEQLLRKWDNYIGQFLRCLCTTAVDKNLIDISRIDSVMLGKFSKKESLAKGCGVGCSFKVSWGQDQ